MKSVAPVITALLAWLAFPPVGAWPLAFVAWVPLLVSLRRAKPREALLQGLVAGAIMNGLGGSFLYATLLRESGLSAPVAALVFALFAAWQGLRAGLASFVAVRARERGWALGPAFVLASTGLEAAFPMPLPWAFAASVSHVVPLVQIAELGGASAVSAMLYAASAGIAGAIAPATTRTRLRAALVGVAPIAVAALLGPILLERQAGRTSATRSVRVGVVHTDRRTHDPADVPGLLDAANALAARGAALVVTSESSLPGAFPEDELDAALRIAAADRLVAPTILGATIGVESPTNSAVTLSREGLLERYDKHRLLPFAERMPLSILDGWTRAGAYRAGADRPRRDAAIRASISICYEDTIAEAVRGGANAAPTNLLVNITNDAWFEGSSEPDLHLALARLRAVELRRTFVRSANQGRSAVIDATGEIVATPDDTRTILVDLPLLDHTTLYQRIGEGPAWAALGVAIALAAVRRPARIAGPSRTRAGRGSR